MAVNDRIMSSLVRHGGGTINERVYNYLGSLGYTGTISDRLDKYTHNNKHGWQALIEGFGLSGSAGVLRQELFGDGQGGVMYVPQPTYLGQQVLYQDSAGTTPVTADGDTVGLMLDLSPNGNDATQSTSAARPLYRTDGTLHWLEFDGVDDTLEIGQMTPGGGLWLGAAIRHSAANVKVYGAHTGTGDAEGTLSVDSSGDGKLEITIGGEFTSPRTPLGGTGVDSVLSSAYDGQAEAYVKYNGGSKVSSSASGAIVDSAVTHYLGSLIGSSGFYDGRLYGVLRAEYFISEEEEGRAEQYLANLAGVTL